MQFTNFGEPVQIRVGKANDCHWDTIETGESVELPKDVGLSLGLTIKTTRGKIGNKVVETKQISVPEKLVQNKESDEEEFFYELCNIKGIGTKTAQDIILIFPDREGLKNKIKNNETLPFRENIDKLLEEFYGKK